ncbi:PepSY domain-containing protein [Spirulina major]|uniref:PepSY domain-containing protein n=1 Tax=Spirulina major TaxID=270636 RepID=UPI000932D8D5|nr:PepSY domain-containing protein [Spirulina major]
MKPTTIRKFHRTIAPIFFLPLFATALTGVIYRVGRAWFNLPHQDWLMIIHQGEFLGKPLVPVYVLLMGVGLLGLIVTGGMMTKQLWGRPAKQTDRRWHRIVGAIALLPLILSATTGIIYRLARTWFGLDYDQVGIFLSIHEGRYFGTILHPIYVLLVGVGLIILLITGIRMTGIVRQRRRST